MIRDKLADVNFDAIICSTVYRARQTADIINVSKVPIKYDERLVERDPGNLLGKRRDEIDKSEWYRLDIDRTAENVETLGSCLRRTKECLDDIYEKYKGKNILIVTHNCICNCIWILENNITDLDRIAQFLQKNDEIKIYDSNQQLDYGER